MTIYIEGTKKNISEQMIMEAAEGDNCITYKKPLRYIHLTWAHYDKKRVGNMSKFKGFEDTFIKLTAGGGLIIKHRIPGSARFAKQPLGGKYTSVLADTEHNRRYLASMYYDKLWTIREADVDRDVKIAADQIDEQLKKNTVSYMIDKPIRDENGIVKKWGQEKVIESEYDFHKRRREAQFTRGSRHKIQQSTVQSMQVKEDQTDRLVKEKAELAKKKAELEQREAALKQAEDILRENIGTAKNEKPGQEELNTEYTVEVLTAMRPVSKLRGIAKKLGTVEDTSKMKTEELVSEIINLQSKAAIEPVSEEVETIAG
ncbi:MAG TPA: hypothetical protein VMV77_12495 [Bacteroidales bacterium]|nr:hypothetical protein [Bacteroidales bacterium]